MGCVSLFRHWASLSCCTEPYHQYANEQRTGLQFQLYARPPTQGSLRHCTSLASVVPTGGAVYPTGAHTGLTFLNSCPETNGLCWGTAAGKEGKKKALFYYSEVHFNLHKRHCVCDGLHEEKHYSPASLARKKIREIWEGLKTIYCNAEFW